MPSATPIPSPDEPRIRPFPHLLRSTRIDELWTMRILFGNFEAQRLFLAQADDPFPVAAKLRLPDVNPIDRDATTHLLKRLRVTLTGMEQRRQRFKLTGTLSHNLVMVARSLGLSRVEQNIVALVIMLNTYEGMGQLKISYRNHDTAVRKIATIIGSSTASVMRALASNGLLVRSGLIVLFPENDSYSRCPRLGWSSFRRLTIFRARTPDELFAELLRPARPGHLTLQDYEHLLPAPEVPLELIRHALDTRRIGVNVLLHGPPGTGKTELVRALAAKLAVNLFEVPFSTPDGRAIEPRERLHGASAGQILLQKTRSLLVFDEIDAVFNDGSDLFGKQATAETSKCWVNTLLETNAVPTVWIANNIRKMDPAFLRRFDLVLKVDTPPLRKRMQLLERACGHFLDAGQLQRVAYAKGATPAIVERAASVINRVRSSTDDPASLFETVLDGVLAAQGHATIKQASRDAVATRYDVSLCNADYDLLALVEGLTERPAARICLHGPPGTGKTAFGKWLAFALGRPLVLKRYSDIQSPLLGEMEQNLAQAFHQASRDNAVLQFDEVDSYLQDRRGAQRGWEVAQVNEFLTQLESYEGIMIASTNLMEGLDPAALRRFDFKIRLGYLEPEQVRSMLLTFTYEAGLSPPNEALLEPIRLLKCLTPGDFAVLRRQHRARPFATSERIMEALTREHAGKVPPGRRIGFL